MVTTVQLVSKGALQVGACPILPVTVGDVGGGAPARIWTDSAGPPAVDQLATRGVRALSSYTICDPPSENQPSSHLQIYHFNAL